MPDYVSHKMIRSEDRGWAGEAVLTLGILRDFDRQFLQHASLIRYQGT